MTSKRRAGPAEPEVLVDLRWCQGQPAGIGRYVLDLAVTLSQHLRVRGLARPGARPLLPFDVTVLPNVPNFRFDVMESVVARRMAVPLISLSRLPVLLARSQAIPMIFDLSPLILPQTHPRVRGYLERCTYTVAARANTIITLSQTSRRDLVQRLGIPVERICVIRPGRPETHPGGERETTLGELGIRGDYVLAVGTLEPRKNLTVVMEALERSPELPLQLVVAGGLGWKYAPILERMRKLQLEGRLVYLGYVSERDKAVLYRNAMCLAYPSLYEGFGLPILEAMTYGTAVIVSNAPACVEVIGPAGIVLDPNDSAAWADAIARLNGDPALRAALGRTGQARSEQFSWQRSIVPLVERLTQPAAAAA